MSLFGRYGTWVGGMGLAAALLTGSPAQAQTTIALPEPGTFDVTPFIGFGFGLDAGGPAPFNAVDDTSFLLGVAVAYNFTTNLALEGELGIHPDVVGDTDAVDVRVITLSANGVYHFDIGRNIVPYATAGIGFGRASWDIEGDDDDDNSRTEFALNIGGGVKAAINEKIAVRGDLRYIGVNDELPNFWRVYGGVAFRFGQR